uniref:Uncharacterized protein n=1 Tax=Melicertus latisulcatus pemonivirus TaxID=2984278 RepID=A0A9C7BZF7_9VIRU|nr:MAG: hypothetical protein [Melicertus latisulcatus pemonivirus]
MASHGSKKTGNSGVVGGCNVSYNMRPRHGRKTPKTETSTHKVYASISLGENCVLTAAGPQASNAGPEVPTATVPQASTAGPKTIKMRTGPQASTSGPKTNKITTGPQASTAVPKTIKLKKPGPLPEEQLAYRRLMYALRRCHTLKSKTREILSEGDKAMAELNMAIDTYSQFDSVLKSLVEGQQVPETGLEIVDE